MSAFRGAPAALLIVALAGCQAAPGPLDFGGDSASTVCLGRSADVPMLVGDFFTVPASAGSATITGVRLADPQGIELMRSWLQPAIAGALGASEYPPDDSAGWAQRETAVGAVIQAGTQMNVVALVAREGSAEATASAIVLDYRIGGVSYSKQGTMAIEIRDNCVDG
ncbi:hypothetical protein BH09ACT4_BH09ACT4_25490 [soil metagenome]